MNTNVSKCPWGWEGGLADLEVVTGLLAVGDPLHLRGGGQVQRLAQVGEGKRPCYPHVGERQVVDVQQGAQAGQTVKVGEREDGEGYNAVTGQEAFIQIYFLIITFIKPVETHWD